MARITRTSLSFWVAAWLIGVSGLALSPAQGTNLQGDSGGTVLYSPAQTNTVYVDADGQHSVIVRNLRPFVAD